MRRKELLKYENIFSIGYERQTKMFKASSPHFKLVDVDRPIMVDIFDADLLLDIFVYQKTIYAIPSEIPPIN